jgi:hypothetical protein
VTLARPDTGREPQQIDTKLRQTPRLAEYVAHSLETGLIKWRRVSRAGALLRRRQIDFFTDWLRRFLHGFSLASELRMDTHGGD